MSPKFSEGARVTWTCAGRRVIEFGRSVPAVVCKVGAKRIQVEAARMVPYSLPTRMERVQRWVEPAELEERVCPSSTLGEELRMEVDGFVLVPLKHPMVPPGSYKVFPNGIWYGTIDGYECTAPCSTPDAALYQAHQALIRNAYRVSVLTHIETFEHWLKTPTEPYASQARTELVDLRARLAKIDQSEASARA